MAFRGTDAIRAGLVTPGQLRGPNYLRLFPDTYVRRGDEPPNLVVRSLAAYLYTGRRGILSGYSAAEVQQASCGPLDAPAELTLPGGGHPRPGLLVHRDRLDPDEIQMCRGLPVTTPVRTAYDLARWQEQLIEAVVAVDALANRGQGDHDHDHAGFDPADVLRLAKRHPGARGSARLPRVVELADRRSGSPMETRLRLVLVLRGLPVPEVQYPVLDDRRRRAVWLDLAYPEHRIGIEYEGADHANPDRVLRDVSRYTRLVADSWRIYRFTKFEIYREQDRIAATIWQALDR